MLTVASITGALEQKYPPSLAASWDNSGLQLGAGNEKVTGVLVALDCTMSAVKQAEEVGAQLIITHHPLIFNGLKHICFDHPQGRLIRQLCSCGMSVYSLHTNLDRAPDGLNSHLARKLGILNPQVFGEVIKQPYYKLVVYVPATHLHPVREALAAAGAGHIGEYSHCSFAAPGEGTFLPGPGTRPFLGQEGVLQQVEEYRLESIVSGHILDKCINDLRAAHPYEEMAYEVYSLQQPAAGFGYGRYGQLAVEITLGELAAQVKKNINISEVRIAGDIERKINRAAVVSGSGASMIAEAAAAGADVLITGDIKYHEAQEALSLGLNLIDAGHDGLEREAIALLSNELKVSFPDTLQVFPYREELLFKIL
ncbi:MAG: Nif3-like dinuclear metal center hexameric protein [Methylocystaceae bacterium]